MEKQKLKNKEFRPYLNNQKRDKVTAIQDQLKKKGITVTESSIVGNAIDSFYEKMKED